MNFKEVEPASVPAFDVFAERLGVLRPNATVVKVGHESVFDIIRIYVETLKPIRFNVDIRDNLLNDLDSDSHNSPSKYRSELVAQLDAIIEAFIPVKE